MGADIVIDVHADMEAAVHMYSSAASWPQLRGLAERLAAKAVILCDISADRPFDEAHSHSWSQVERFLIGQGVEPERGVASCTVELRGLADVTPRLAEADRGAYKIVARSTAKSRGQNLAIVSNLNSATTIANMAPNALTRRSRSSRPFRLLIVRTAKAAP